MVYSPVLGFTLSHRKSYAPSGVKLPPPHCVVTRTHPLHIEVEESVQSADPEYVVSIVAAATTVLPVKGTVNDITAGFATGSVDTHVPLYFSLETGYAKFVFSPMPRSEGGHNSQIMWSIAKL